MIRVYAEGVVAPVQQLEAIRNRTPMQDVARAVSRHHVVPVEREATVSPSASAAVSVATASPIPTSRLFVHAVFPLEALQWRQVHGWKIAPERPLANSSHARFA